MPRRFPATPLAVSFALLLCAAAPLGALVIIPPFKPFGPLDPALLRGPDHRDVEWMTLEGRVVGEDGEPVPGAEVILRAFRRCDDCYDEDLSLPTRFTRSDADGMFYLPDLDPEPIASVDISATGFATTTFDLGQIGRKRYETVFRLPGGGGVVLVAVDEEGRPLPETKATIWAAGDGASLTFLVLSEADESWTAAREDGSLRFHGLAAGLSNLALRAPGRRLSLVGVTVPAGGQPLDLGKVKLEPAARLRGKVVDASGEPIAGATVRSQLAIEPLAEASFYNGQEGETDAEGLFDLPWTLPSDFEFQVMAMAEGYSSSSRLFTSEPEEPFELALGSRRQIRGQVVRQGSGEGIAECNLYATVSGTASGSEDSDTATTDQGGHFELALAPREAFEITYDCGNGWESLEVGEGTEQPLRIEVMEGTFLRGRLVDYREENAAGLTFGGMITAVEPDGAFAFENVKAGEGDLLVDSGGRSYVVRVRVPEDGLEGLEIEEPDDEDLVSLEGVVYDPWGKLAGLTWIQVFTAAGIPVAAESTHPDGTFTVARLEAGPGQLLVQSAGRYFVADVDLRKNAKKVVIRFPAGTTLTGRVEGIDAAETHRLSVRAQRSFAGPGDLILSEDIQAKVDTSGHFVLEQLPEGDWTLLAGVFGRNLMAQEQIQLQGQDSETVTLHLSRRD